MSSALYTRIGMPPFGPVSGGTAYTNTAVDASSEGYGCIIEAQDTDPITHIGFRYGARTGTPPTYIASLQTAGTADGLPDGTPLGGGSPASVTFTPPADATWNSTWQWVQLANAYTPTRGQKLAVVIEYSSGTVDGSNNSSFSFRASALGGTGAIASPYLVSKATTWSKDTNNALCPMGLRTASNRYGFVHQSFDSTRITSTVGNRVAMAFTLPSGWGSTFKLAGVRFHGSLAGATGKAPVMGLWDAAGAMIQDKALDSDIVGQVGASSATGLNDGLYFNEASLTALSFGTEYYVGFEVGDAANGGIVLYSSVVANADDLLAYPLQTSAQYATWNGSAWSKTATMRPMMELLLDDITEPSGGAINPFNGLIVGRAG